MERTVVAETEGLDGVAHGAGRRPDYSCVAGAGAFLSTPTDLVRLGSAMLKPGLLRADTIAAFQTPTRLVSGASTTYALGWTVRSVQLAGEPARIVSHRGSPAGGTVSLLTFPDLGLAIAAAANVTDARGVDPFALQVAEAFARHQDRQTARRSLKLSPRGSHHPPKGRNASLHRCSVASRRAALCGDRGRRPLSRPAGNRRSRPCLGSCRGQAGRPAPLGSPVLAKLTQ